MDNLFNINSELFPNDGYNNFKIPFDLIGMNKEKIATNILINNYLNVSFENNFLAEFTSANIVPYRKYNSGFNEDVEQTRLVANKQYNINSRVEEIIKPELKKQIVENKYYLIPREKVLVFLDKDKITIKFKDYYTKNKDARFYLLSKEKLESYKFLKNINIDLLFKNKCFCQLFRDFYCSEHIASNIFLIGNESINGNKLADLNNWLYKKISLEDSEKNSFDDFIQTCTKKEDLLSFD